MLTIKGINTTVGQDQQAGMKKKQVLEDSEMHLARRDTEGLFQEQPEIGNPYLEDTLLRSYLKTHLPPKVSLCSCVYPPRPCRVAASDSELNICLSLFVPLSV